MNGYERAEMKKYENENDGKKETKLERNVGRGGINNQARKV